MLKGVGPCLGNVVLSCIIKELLFPICTAEQLSMVTDGSPLRERVVVVRKMKLVGALGPRGSGILCSAWGNASTEFLILPVAVSRCAFPSGCLSGIDFAEAQENNN